MEAMISEPSTLCMTQRFDKALRIESFYSRGDGASDDRGTRRGSASSLQRRESSFASQKQSGAFVAQHRGIITLPDPGPLEQSPIP